MFQLSRKHRAAIIVHAREACPNECCGLLVGSGGRIVKLYKLANAENSPLAYRLDPYEQLRIFQEMDNHGWELMAIYHSHVASPAYPSARDVELAYYPEAVYLVVSLTEPARPDVRAFRIKEGAIAEEKIVDDDELTPGVL
ncbi:MAG: M67 family metallopeptidase [Chloroflexi bacterium]|nr:M67 family metallopeptidase [Chloroflexota bacterium]